MRCADAALEASEPLAATAPVATCWVVIEQPGPWGRQALLDSPLDPGVGAALAERASGSGTTVLLARHATRPARSWDPLTRRAWIADVARGILLEGTLPDPRAALDWDLAAMAEGGLPAFGERRDEPLLLACTHSGRDACCAVLGRALVDATGLWECSHLGGHRFAATVLVLPDGYLHGRVDPPALGALRAARERDRLHLPTCRGRSAYARPLQCAELAVRAMEGIAEVGAFADVTALGAGEVRVTHADGRSWHVRVRQERLPGERPESCGGEPSPVEAWRAVSVARSG